MQAPITKVSFSEEHARVQKILQGLRSDFYAFIWKPRLFRNHFKSNDRMCVLKFFKWPSIKCCFCEQLHLWYKCNIQAVIERLKWRIQNWILLWWPVYQEIKKHYSMIFWNITMVIMPVDKIFKNGANLLSMLKSITSLVSRRLWF